jgi:hypothetical protein
LTLHHEPIKKKLKPGIDHDYLLLRFVHFLTKVDWSITDRFDHVPLLPSDNNFQALENAIGHGKPLGPLLHFSGLLPYIVNSKTENNCLLQQKYREYPPASWPHAFSCANKCQNKYSKEGREDECSSIIYIAESLIPTNDCNPDFLKWVKNQPDIYILDGDEEGNKFQFVLSEEMHRYFAPLPEANNKRVLLSKEAKKKLRNAFGKYTATYTHQITLKSTLPYVAKDSLSKNRKLDFMDVISILSLVYGNSPEYGLKRQLKSSSCFTSNEALYGYKEDQENKKEQEELITDNESEEESVLDFNMQKASLSPQHKRGKVLRNIDQLNLRS